MNYCHNNHVAHRDLKPENILQEKEGQIKIIDFGTASPFNREQGMNSIMGTPYYMAPEVLKGQVYNEKCDVWSCGVIMYVMLTGQPPFYGKNDAEIIEKVKKGVYS